ncbi:hypothetical protein FB45DRAFT_896539 [Roridomyces roridus]|uniref:Ubiquitin-like protease family profile domain-containing protein n=1 Tax=Roridomyces roridus TaxID=1738132 RepID=A0AAD7FY75_9AGAR|nr:hypothetical protein FB45DRAFT_896539 [Roridomyces roridus]
MSASIEDRNAIGALHHPLPPSSLRDASQGSQPWTKAPTKIAQPTNGSRVSGSAAQNPYDRSGQGKWDNLNTSRKGGNPNNVNFNEYIVRGQPPAKKQKVESSNTPKPRKKVSQPQPRPSDSSSSRKPGQRDDEGVLLVDGQYIDTKNSPFIGKMNGNVTAGPSRHDARSVSGTTHSRVPLAPEDDPVVIDSDSDDPIESFPEEKKGHVTEKVAHYEKLDLENMSAGIKNRMKARKQNQDAARATADSKPVPVTRAQQSSPFLPINAWFLGRKLFEEPYYLTWMHSGKMTIKSGEGPGSPSRHYEEVDMKTIAEKVWFVKPADPRDKYLFLETGQGVKRQVQKALGAGYSKYFKLGGKHCEGDISIKFDMDSPNWIPHSYLVFYDWLQNNVDERAVLGGPAGDAKWDMAIRISQMVDTKVRRESGLDEEPVKGRQRKKSGYHAKSAIPDDWESRPENCSPPRESGSDWSPPPLPTISKTPATADTVQTARSGSPDTPIEIESPQRPTPRPLHSEAEPTRRSTRQSVAPPRPNVDLDEVILVYPPGQTGAVNVTNGDVLRLSPGEFLNDTLIEFGLKLWLQELEKTNPELVKQIHVFSSFFYKKLTNKGAKQGYESVKKWTSKFNLFDKKFIIVPINENLHWYLAIIYYPEHVLKPPLPTKSPVTRRKTRQGPDEQHVAEIPSEKPPDSKASSVTRGSSTPPEVEKAPTPTTSDGQADAEEVNEMMKSSCSITEDDIPEKEGARDDHDSLFSDDNMEVDVETVEDGDPSSVTLVDDDGSKTASEEPTTVPVHETMDVDDPDVADQSKDPLDLFDSPPPISRAVAPVNFYGNSSRKRKARSPILDTFPPTGAPHRPDLLDEDDGEEVVVVSDQPSTYIFTLDSLGGRHPKVVKVLGQYLRQEAQEKRGIPSEQCSSPTGKTAQVPHQPNFCDCGIYLLHLAQTFISDPDRYCKIILQSKKMNAEQRGVTWKSEGTLDFRETLRTRIGELSRDWKKAKQEELKKKEADVVPDSSDDEVDIVETTPAPSSLPPHIQRKARAAGGASTIGRASRLR